MYIKKEDLTIVIVTFESEHVIYECIKSIDEELDIIVIDNSNNFKLKNKIEKKYKNTKCILSSKNLGMGPGNNLGIENVKTNYALIINPDVILEKNTINELIEASKKIDKFAIIAPISDNRDYPNYKLFKKTFSSNINPFKVKSIDGFAMLFNLKRLKEIKNFYFFDENFFLYLENDDLCKRVNDSNEDIYVVPKSKIKHFGGKAVNQLYKFEIELSRNWHWIWSKFYFNKKHYGFIFAFMNGLPSFLSAIIKFCIYFIFNNQKKKKIYYNRCSGFLNALFGRKSFYRPNINS